MDVDGSFYGDMQISGIGQPQCAEGCGTVFKLTP
jgi:hypothetical protein